MNRMTREPSTCSALYAEHHLVPERKFARQRMRVGTKTLLEVEAQAQLNLTRVVALSCNHSKSLLTLQVDRRIEEIDVVESVEKFRGKRQTSPLRKEDLLRETQVQVPISQTPECAASRGRIHARLNGAKLV